jgi:hypothetical protein
MATAAKVWADTSASLIGAGTADCGVCRISSSSDSAKVLAAPALRLGDGDAITTAVTCARSRRRASSTVTPNADSPRIPHDKVAKMTVSCHMALSEGHLHPPAEYFESSLNFCCECASDEDKWSEPLPFSGSCPTSARHPRSQLYTVGRCVRRMHRLPELRLESQEPTYPDLQRPPLRHELSEAE